MATPAFQDTAPETQLVEPVGTSSAQVTTAVTLLTGGTLASIAVLTQGAADLDFQVAPGGTCTAGAVYTAGQTCTVGFTFRPTHPGLRFGGISLTAEDGTLLGNSYIHGTGTGPQLAFSPGLQSMVGAGLLGASGAAVNGRGDVFISALGGQTVTEVPADGSAILPFGAFTDAEDVTVDGSGNVFVITTDRTTVSEILAVQGVIPPSPVIRTVVTGLTGLNGIKVDASGDIFLASSILPAGNGSVYEIAAVDGSIPALPAVATLWSGSGGPTGVAVDPGGDVFFSDQTNNAVYEIAAVNGVIPPSPALRAIGGGFSSPSNVALDADGNVYVTDYGNQAVKEVFAVDGTVPASDPVIATIGSGFKQPQGLVVDSSGNVFVADSGLPSVTKVDYADPPTLTFAATPVGSTSSDSPETVTITNIGNEPLTLLPPATGINPAITPGFTLDNSSTCPLIAAFTNVAATLAAGTSCTDVVSFTPTAAGPERGTLTTADDNLNVPGSTQTVRLNGVGVPVTVTVTLSANPGAVFLLNAVTLTATVSSSAGAPAGAVTFSEGTTILGSSALTGGVATLTLTSLGLGAHSLTASFGDGPAAVASRAVTVLVEDFSLSFTQPALTIAHGGTAVYSLTVAPVGGATLPAPVQLTVAGAPDSSTITFAPQPVPAGAGATPVTLTIRTPDYPVGPFSMNVSTPGTLTLAGLGTFFACGRRRRALSNAMRRLGCALLLVACLSLTACGSGWKTQQYTVTVTASSGPLSHAATASLTSK